MTNINYNIHHYDEKSDSYPYGIDDVIIGYILLKNNIEVLHTNYWYTDYYSSSSEDKEYLIANKEKFIAFHTNKYK